MEQVALDSRAAWRVADLNAVPDWVFTLDDRARHELAASVKAAYVTDKPLFEYCREDFNLDACWPVISAAVTEAHHGRGLALLHGLPRDGLTEQEFELMSWAIGLSIGVARPQGRDTRYITRVSNAGTDYRAPTGRGYSSNAALDFHVDGADLTTLTCYNKAKSGGQSMVTSSVSARNQLVAERPDLAELLHGEYCFSRQGEQAEDERPFYVQRIFEAFAGRVFGKWNRNRAMSAQQLPGVPTLSARQHEALDLLDEVLLRPELLLTMYLEPGDLQIMNNYVMLHSRTTFTDFDELQAKRLLFRLWLAPPDSIRLPPSWQEIYRSVEPGAVRGGFRGHQYDHACRDFEMRQAGALGMQMLES